MLVNSVEEEAPGKKAMDRIRGNDANHTPCKSPLQDKRSGATLRVTKTRLELLHAAGHFVNRDNLDAFCG
jgi:hypothetical protein